MSKESDNNKQVLLNQLAQAELDLSSAEEYLERARVRRLKILGALEYHEQMFTEEEKPAPGTVAAVEDAGRTKTVVLGEGGKREKSKKENSK